MLARHRFCRLLSSGLLASTLTVFAPCFSQATTILIDFGKTGQATTTYSGNTWNNVAAAEATQFTDNQLLLANALTTANTATTIDLRLVDGPLDNMGIGFSDTTSVNATSLGYPQSASRDQMYVIGNSVLRLEQLATDGTTYDLRMYGAIDDGAGRVSRWIVGGVPKTLAVEDNNTGVVDFLGILPNGSGQIVIDFQQAAAVSAVWSVFEINVHPIPEPSSLAMLLCGGVTIWLSKRKRTR